MFYINKNIINEKYSTNNDKNILIVTKINGLYY